MFPIPSLAFPKIHFQSEKLFVPKHKKTQKQKNMSNLQIFDLMFPIKMEVAPELLKNGKICFITFSFFLTFQNQLNYFLEISIRKKEKYCFIFILY